MRPIEPGALAARSAHRPLAIGSPRRRETPLYLPFAERWRSATPWWAWTASCACGRRSRTPSGATGTSGASCPTLHPLLDLDSEHVLVTHGPPVIGGGARGIGEGAGSSALEHAPRVSPGRLAPGLRAGMPFALVAALDRGLVRRARAAGDGAGGADRHVGGAVRRLGAVRRARGARGGRRGAARDRGRDPAERPLPSDGDRPSARRSPARAPRRAAEGQAVVDASWAMANQGDGRFDRDLLVGATLPQYPAWVLGTALGVARRRRDRRPGEVRAGRPLSAPSSSPCWCRSCDSRTYVGWPWRAAALALVLALTPVAPAECPCSRPVSSRCGAEAPDDRRLDHDRRARRAHLR